MTITSLRGVSVVPRYSAEYAAAVATACAVAGLVVWGHGRLAIGLVLMGGGCVLARRGPQTALLSLIAFQIVIGDFRRLLIPLVGWSGQDPLLLVVPAIIGLMAVTLFVSKRLNVDTSLSKAVAALMSLMCLQILNPAQGGVAVGVMGGLFYLVPLLWFWLGRIYADRQLVERLLRRVVLPLALAATALVLYQSLVGFLPFEQTWIDTAGYAALYVGDTVRPFGFSTSAAECSRLLSIAVVVASAYALRGGNRTALLIAAAAFVGMFVVGSRSPVVMSVLAVAVMWSVQSRSVTAWAPRFALIGVVAAAVLVWGLQQATLLDASSSTVQNAIDHQTEGLLDPGNDDTSTAGLHLVMFAEGLVAAFHTPLGMGLGATTKAADKFGSGEASSEVDISDVILSLGALGGTIYAIILIVVVVMAVRVWRQTHSAVALATLGVLLVCGGQWLRGGEYGTVALVWFLVGALDRAASETRTRLETGSAPYPSTMPCS